MPRCRLFSFLSFAKKDVLFVAVVVLEPAANQFHWTSLSSSITKDGDDGGLKRLLLPHLSLSIPLLALRDIINGHVVSPEGINPLSPHHS